MSHQYLYICIYHCCVARSVCITRCVFVYCFLGISVVCISTIVYVYQYLSVQHVYHCLYASMSVYQCLCVPESVCISIFVYQCLCVPVFMRTNIYVYHCLCTSIRMYHYLCVPVYVCVPACTYISSV